MFNADSRGIHAGMLGPVGTARVDDDGFTVSGKYQFGSGCAHATWFGAGTQEVDAAGEPLNDASGLPALRVVFLRPEQVVLRGNWNVLGLAGTGSYDYTVDDQFVAEGFSFPLLTAVPRRGGATYNIGLFGIVASGHAGFALGVGARALDELLGIVPTKQRMGSFTSVADEQLFQHDFAMQDAAVRAVARATSSTCSDRRRPPHSRAVRRHSCSSSACGRPRRTQRGWPPTRRGSPTRGRARVHCATGARCSDAFVTFARGHPAHLRRQQHAHRLHAGVALVDVTRSVRRPTAQRCSSSRRMTLPVPLRGSSSTNSTSRGTL